MVVIHCNDRFWEDVHAEIVGSGGSDVGRCHWAIGDMVHVELHRDRVGYVNVKSARIRAILNGGFDHLKGSRNGSNRFGGLHWNLYVTNESRRLVLIFRLDHDIRERAWLGMAERIYDIIHSSDIEVANYGGQQKSSDSLQRLHKAYQARQ